MIFVPKDRAQKRINKLLEEIKERDKKRDLELRKTLHEQHILNQKKRNSKR